jgi:3-hydroxyisobutyrate dehydrogenase-like beta-hydroxyacid dehydrogenase
MTERTIAFIGLGAMGLPMAQRLLGAGFAVVGFDPQAERCEALRAAGGRVARDAAEAADAAFCVLACLPSAAHSVSVAQGIASAAAAGSAPALYIECSTIGQAAMQRVHAALAPAGVALLDAPISGGPEGAAAGTLSTVVSGGREAQREVREVLGTYASTIVDAGEMPGLAQVYKLINQALTFAAFLLTAEGIAAGVKAGADAHALLEFLNASTARNWSTTTRFPQSVLPRTFGRGSLSIVRKDMDAYIALCRESGALSPMGDSAVTLFALADSLLAPPVDLASVVRLFEAATGTPISNPNGANAPDPS